MLISSAFVQIGLLLINLCLLSLRCIVLVVIINFVSLLFAAPSTSHSHRQCSSMLTFPDTQVSHRFSHLRSQLNCRHNCSYVCLFVVWMYFDFVVAIFVRSECCFVDVLIWRLSEDIVTRLNLFTNLSFTKICTSELYQKKSRPVGNIFHNCWTNQKITSKIRGRIVYPKNK